MTRLQQRSALASASCLSFAAELRSRALQDAISLTRGFSVLDPLSAAYILARISLSDFLALDPAERLTAFGPVLGQDRVSRINDDLRRKLDQADSSSSSSLPPSPPSWQARPGLPLAGMDDAEAPEKTRLLEEMGLVSPGVDEQARADLDAAMEEWVTWDEREEPGSGMEVDDDSRDPLDILTAYD